ncbi:response regulator [Paraburkholderia sp.]|uniref:response regulator n=1 Tax=Paraburkholderia sp. TaxID=1926495 RepID=UPI002603923F|nr:response regulator [Paraburkholderia sp.]
MNPQVLIVDDDPVVRDLLCRFLQSNGFDASVLHDGTHLQRRLERERPSVVVLDIMMPNTDGLRALTALRAAGDDIPVIFVTARGTVADRIVGLSLGADDYLTKPFDPRELLAKIRSVLRRTRNAPTPRIPEPSAYVSFAGWRLDTATKQMLAPDGVMITLGGSDYRTLRTLLDNPNRPLSRDYLLDEVFGKEGTPLDRSIDVCISRLRQHLKDTARQPKLIRTVRHEGYMLTASVVHESHA